MFMKKRFIGVLASAVLLAAMAAAPANASISLAISPGTLNFDGGAPTIGNFSNVTLNGTPQLTSLSITPFTVVDATGTGDGWNVLLTIPDLTDAATDVIASTNITMTAPVVTAASPSSITGVSGVAITAGSGLATGDEIVTAAATDGEGTYLVAPRILKLTIPVTTLKGTYTSAATIATVDGP
jgi:WxL domain surface cell wall-binding